MGCKAITPALVSLASRLEGKPFHLVASFCQKGERAPTVAYVKSKGLSADTPNMTVTYQGRHPQVKGNGYVPYYMVFDHTGKMVHHHMCGSYHGGDGMKMIEWVDDLLEKAPEIWLGEEPFEQHAKLAEQIAEKKNLAKAITEVEALDDDEAARILAGLTRYRDRGLAGAESLLAKRPSQVVATLETLAEEMGESTLGEPVHARLGELSGSDDIKRAVALEKDFLKQQKRLDKAKPCKSCKRDGAKQHVVGCSTCAEDNAKTLRSIGKKLDALAEKADGLPFQTTITALRAQLGS